MSDITQLASQELTTWLTIVSAYFLTRIAEARRGHFEMSSFVFSGTDESILKMIKWLHRLIFIFLPFAVVEFLIRKNEVTREMQTLAITAVMFGLTLRFWAVHHLRKIWFLKSYAISPERIAKGGPFKLLKHPENLSRALEGAGLLAFLGSIYVAAMFLTLFFILCMKIVNAERKQLELLSFE